MNKLLTTIILSSFICFGSFAQCNFDQKMEECTAKLDKKFTLLRMYDLSKLAKTEKLEFSNVFSRGNEYKLQTCFGNKSNDVIVKLYDRKHKFITSNYDAEKDKISPTLAYKCKRTDIYYLEFEYNKQLQDCRYGLLAFQ